MDTKKTAWDSGNTMTLSESFVPKTVQELKKLCATRPNHPVAIDIINAITDLPEDTICNILPISILAIERNCKVEVTYQMEEVISPVDGTRTFKKVRQFHLGGSLEEVPAA